MQVKDIGGRNPANLSQSKRRGLQLNPVGWLWAATMRQILTNEKPKEPKKPSIKDMFEIEESPDGYFLVVCTGWDDHIGSQAASRIRCIMTGFKGKLARAEAERLIGFLNSSWGTFQRCDRETEQLLDVDLMIFPHQNFVS